MRVNLGCGAYPIPGWLNVDLHTPADLNADLRTLSLPEVEEVEMSHVLEHLPWCDTVPVLRRIHSWMVPGGRIRVEVPDWDVLSDMSPGDACWAQWVWGEQSHDGEYHRSGFDALSLRRALTEAGWTVDHSRAFVSDHPARPGYPCLEVQAHA